MHLCLLVKKFKCIISQNFGCKPVISDHIFLEKIVLYAK